MVDLHTHSSCSDGTFTPAGLVDEGLRRGLYAIALTDHDTVEGNTSFLAAAALHGARAIAGVEISAEYAHPEGSTRGRDEGEMHILGYFSAWGAVAESGMAALTEIRHNRDERNPQIVRKLQELGCDITYEEIVRHADNDVVGRPHIAAVLIEKGIVRNTQEAFDRYLSKFAPAFVRKKVFPPERAIRLIADAGGIPVLAHPKTLEIKSDAVLHSVIGQLVAQGLRGIEAYYPIHDPRDVERQLSCAKEFGLLVTGGSDFHGANKPDIALGTGFGRLAVPDDCFDALCAAERRVPRM